MNSSYSSVKMEIGIHVNVSVGKRISTELPVIQPYKEDASPLDLIVRIPANLMKFSLFFLVRFFKYLRALPTRDGAGQLR
jgi:hypothetical protein